MCLALCTSAGWIDPESSLCCTLRRVRGPHRSPVPNRQTPELTIYARLDLFVLLTKLSQNLTKTEDFDGFFADNGVYRCKINFFHSLKMPQAACLPSYGEMKFGAVGARELRGIGEK